MIEKEIVINILQEIDAQLTYHTWHKANNTVDIYIRNLEITTNEKVKKLINKYVNYRERFGEDNIKTRIVAKKIDKELSNIFNKKY